MKVSIVVYHQKTCQVFWSFLDFTHRNGRNKDLNKILTYLKFKNLPANARKACNYYFVTRYFIFTYMDYHKLLITVKLANSAIPFKFRQAKSSQHASLENDKMCFSKKVTEFNWPYSGKTHSIILNTSWLRKFGLVEFERTDGNS